MSSLLQFADLPLWEPTDQVRSCVTRLPTIDLATKLTTKDSPIVIVPQGDGFDPTQDTIADGVHPNASGAAKMANRWFDALVKVMDKPPVSYQPQILPYKKTDKGPSPLRQEILHDIDQLMIDLWN